MLLLVTVCLWKPSDRSEQRLVTGGQDNTISVIAFEGGKATVEKSWKANCVWAVHALAVNSEEDVCVSGGNSDKVR